MAVPGWRKQAIQLPTFGLDDFLNPSAFRAMGMAEVQHIQHTTYSTLLVGYSTGGTPSHNPLRCVALRCIALHCIYRMTNLVFLLLCSSYILHTDLNLSIQLADSHTGMCRISAPLAKLRQRRLERVSKRRW